MWSLFSDLKFSPPSVHSNSSWFCNDFTKSLRLASFRLDHIWVSEYSPNGSRLRRSVPVNRTGSCGIIVSFLRSLCRPTFLISTLSIKIAPWLDSRIRNRPSVRELFPVPVRPTIPIFSPGSITQERSLSTKSRSSRYLTE